MTIKRRYPSHPGATMVALPLELSDQLGDEGGFASNVAAESESAQIRHNGGTWLEEAMAAVTEADREEPRGRRDE